MYPAKEIMRCKNKRGEKMRVEKVFLVVALLFLTVAGCDRFSVQKQLEKYVADQLEKNPLPRKITNLQSLVDIKVGDKELIQTFKIKGSKDKIKAGAAELENQVKAELRKKKDKIQNLIKYKIVMTFRYLQQKTEELLVEFQIKPWEDL